MQLAAKHTLLERITHCIKHITKCIFQELLALLNPIVAPSSEPVNCREHGVKPIGDSGCEIGVIRMHLVADCSSSSGQTLGQGMSLSICELGQDS